MDALYIAPDFGPAYDADAKRMSRNHRVEMLVVCREQHIVEAVSMLCDPDCRVLLVPDACDRHNAVIEDIKACARHMHMPVLPLGRYLRQMDTPKPTPEKPTAHARSLEQTGVGRGAPFSAVPG